MATAEHDVVFETATREEICAELDSLAQESLGISGDQFFALWQDGRLDVGNPVVGRLAVLARLISV